MDRCLVRHSSTGAPNGVPALPSTDPRRLVPQYRQSFRGNSECRSLELNQSRRSNTFFLLLQSKPASSAFLQYISTLPASALSPSEASLLSVSRALVDIAESNQTLNRVFIPVLDTLVLLFEDSDLTRLAGTSSGKTASVLPLRTF